MIRSVKWFGTVLSAFIGVHPRLKIPYFLRANTLPRR
jgi:hypothetical protein